MHIAIEARALSAKSSGTNTYTAQLIKHLCLLKSPHQFSLIRASRTNDVFPANYKNIFIPLNSQLLLPWWLNVSVANLLRQLHPDVTHFTKPILPHRLPSPAVVTIYDLIPLLFPASQKIFPRYLWPRILANAAKRSNHIITISQASKNDLMNIFAIPGEKITVTPLAVDTSRFYPGEKIITAQPYLLFVGTIEPRKNITSLIDAFGLVAKNIPHRLVIAGRVYKGQQQLMTAIARSQYKERISYLGPVTHKALPDLYRQADLFVWPSVYEGWGFPPQEAMACGTPVLVSNGGSLPEVVGTAGAVVDFTKLLGERLDDQEFKEKMAAKILEILGDANKQKLMAASGLDHIKNFSWPQVAATTLGIYESLAGV